MKPRINYFAILACVVMHAVLGMLWFGMIFKGPWTAMNAITDAQLQSGGHSISYVYSIFQSLMMALLLAWLFGRLGVRTVADGAKTAFMVAFATILVAFVTNYSFSFRHEKLALIDSLYPVLSMVIMGVILAAWKAKPAKSPQMARA